MISHTLEVRWYIPEGTMLVIVEHYSEQEHSYSSRGFTLPLNWHYINKEG